MINIEKELTNVQTKMKELETIGYNTTDQPRKAVYNNLILESDLEEYKALSNMYDMLKHNDADTLNEELYNEYKSVAEQHLQEIEEEGLDTLPQVENAIQPQTEKSNEIDLTSIKKRIDEIKYYRLTAKGDREIVIAGGDPVLKENGEEYQILKTIEYIVEHNQQETRKNEFESLLKRLNEINNPTKTMTEPSNQNEQTESSKEENYSLVQEEIQTIKRRMKEIEDSGKLADMFHKTTEVGDNKKVLLEDLGEYDKLKDLLDIIHSKFQTPDAKNYNEIRALTSLGKMDPNKFNDIYNHYHNREKNTTVDINNLNIPKKEENNSRFEFEPVQKSVTPGSELAISEPTEMITQPTDEPKAITPEPQPQPEDDDLIEVKSHKVCQWLNAHKKQILIALGITAVTIGVAVMISQLMPAILAATKASQVASLTTQMLSNGQAWFHASAAGQELLHGANTVLANAVSSLTGTANLYTASSGVWTFGGQTLSSFAASASANAASAVAHVSNLTNLTAGLTAGGLGLFGAGAAIPKAKSKAYKQTKKAINQFKADLDTLTEEEKAIRAEQLTEIIKTNDNISYAEKDILLKKLKKITKSIKNNSQNLDTQEIESPQNQEAEETNMILAETARTL